MSEPDHDKYDINLEAAHADQPNHSTDQSKAKADSLNKSGADVKIPQQQSAGELRELYQRADVSNNRTEDPIGEDEFVAATEQLIASRLRSVLDELETWVKQNKHDMGEMGEFIRTQYVFNKIDEIRALLAKRKASYE